MAIPTVEEWVKNGEKGIADGRPDYVIRSATELEKLNRRDLAEKILRDAAPVFQNRVEIFRKLSSVIRARSPQEALKFAETFTASPSQMKFQQALALDDLGRTLEAIQHMESALDRKSVV